MVKDINNNQKGVSLIITFFIMLIFLVIVLSISILLYSEVKVIRNIGNSVVSFYAADSGIEKILYYDRQVLTTNIPCTGTGQGTCSVGLTCNNGYCTASRGLCLILDPAHNPNSCPQSGSEPDQSVYCYASPNDHNPLKPQGYYCSYTDCTACTVKFGTSFDSGATYSVSAKIEPSGTGSKYTIDSTGNFSSAGREIEILITTPSS